MVSCGFGRRNEVCSDWFLIGFRTLLKITVEKFINIWYNNEQLASIHWNDNIALPAVRAEDWLTNDAKIKADSHGFQHLKSTP